MGFCSAQGGSLRAVLPFPRTNDRLRVARLWPDFLRLVFYG